MQCLAGRISPLCRGWLGRQGRSVSSFSSSDTHFCQVTAGKSQSVPQFPLCLATSPFPCFLPILKFVLQRASVATAVDDGGGSHPDLTARLRWGCCRCRLGKQPVGARARQLLHGGVAPGHSEDPLPSCRGAEALVSTGEPSPWDQRVPVPTEQHLCQQERSTRESDAGR